MIAIGGEGLDGPFEQELSRDMDIYVTGAHL